MIEVLGSLFKLAALILKEYFAARERAQEKQEAFEYNQKVFAELASRAIEKMREDARKDTQNAGSVWDQADKGAGNE